jgi:hypothetical protein
LTAGWISMSVNIKIDCIAFIIHSMVFGYDFWIPLVDIEAVQARNISSRRLLF